MASGLTTAAAARYLDDSFLTAARTAPTTPIKVRLTTTAPTAAAAGTEASGGSYAAQQIDTHMAASGGTNSVASNAILTYTNMPSATIIGVDIFDNAGTPFRWWFGQLTASKTTNSGDTLSFASGAIVANITSP